MHGFFLGAVFVCVQNDKEFGNYVILSHDTGKITSVYAHLQSFTVEKYQTVKKGEIIANSFTPTSTPILSFECI